MDDIGRVKIFKSTEKLVENELYMLKVEKFLSPMEDLLQVIVTVLRNQVYFVKIVKSLVFGENDLQQLDNVRVLALLEQDNLAEDPPRFG